MYFQHFKIEIPKFSEIEQKPISFDPSFTFLLNEFIDVYCKMVEEKRPLNLVRTFSVEGICTESYNRSSYINYKMNFLTNLFFKGPDVIGVRRYSRHSKGVPQRWTHL